MNHVKENDLAHGEFTNWVENKVGIHIREAQRMMLVVNELPNTNTWSQLGVRALSLIATLPEEEILSYFYKKAYNANSKSV